MQSSMSLVACFAASLIAIVNAGVVPYAASIPYATSYSAHSVNHAIAAPVVAPAAYTAPIVAAPAAYSAAVPAAYSAAVPAAYPYSAYPYSAYSAYPYSAYPYAAYPYAAPIAAPIAAVAK